MTRLPEQCRALLEHQHGVIARWQCPQAGLDFRAIETRLRSDRWQVLHRGVYAAFTGEPARLAVLWGAVLRAGHSAVLSHYSAAELDKLADQPAPAIHVMVGTDRRVSLTPRERSSIVVHYSARINEARHPSRTPPRTRIEETTLDLTQCAKNLDAALSWLTCACSRRLTTPQLLRSAAAARPRLRWRAELAGALTDADDGILSLLERRYVHDVERPHGLPAGVRQAVSKAGRRTRYLDTYYREFRVAVEVDGQAAHPAEARWRDIHRDNASLATGIITLRYSWADVTARPCWVAAQVALVLRQHGWQGCLLPCGPRCCA